MSKKEQIIYRLKEIFFIISILPLILNWILGIFYFKNEEKYPYIYRNFIISILFLICSSIFYIIYNFIMNIFFMLSINYLFFVFQTTLILLYVYFAILQIISYYKKKSFMILDKIDLIYKFLLNYI
jgi:hypothetical protein